jgi:hypothetical protein
MRNKLPFATIVLAWMAMSGGVGLTNRIQSGGGYFSCRISGRQVHTPGQGAAQEGQMPGACQRERTA